MRDNVKILGNFKTKMYFCRQITVLRKCEKYEKCVQKQKYFDEITNIFIKCVKIIKNRKV